jgi:hypothetical protein
LWLKALAVLQEVKGFNKGASQKSCLVGTDGIISRSLQALGLCWFVIGRFQV